MSFSWIWMWVKLIQWVLIGFGWVLVAGLLLLVGRVVIFFFFFFKVRNFLKSYFNK